MDSRENKLITPWGYIGYSLLFAIPVVGIIFVFIFSFSSSYPCRKNYARSVLISLIIGVIIALFCTLVLGVNYTAILNSVQSSRY